MYETSREYRKNVIMIKRGRLAILSISDFDRFETESMYALRINIYIMLLTITVSPNGPRAEANE
jgi:hypothetical protein